MANGLLSHGILTFNEEIHQIRDFINATHKKSEVLFYK